LLMRTIFETEAFHIEKFWMDGNNIFVEIHDLFGYQGTLGLMWHKKQWVCFANPVTDDHTLSQVIEYVLEHAEAECKKFGIGADSIQVAQKMPLKQRRFRPARIEYGTRPFLEIK